MSRGHYRVWKPSGLELDLHLANPGDSGACPAAVANVILYHTLLEFAEGTRMVMDFWEVVTGQGHGSREGRAVLPTSTRRFLTEETSPALEIHEVPNNPGKFVVPGYSIEAWVASARCSTSTSSGRYSSSSVGSSTSVYQAGALDAAR